MNERIQELADEAAKFSAVMALPTGESGDRLFVERFAQLIVEECVKLNGKELAMAGHSRMVDVYCEHFGIEY